MKVRAIEAGQPASSFGNGHSREIDVIRQFNKAGYAAVILLAGIGAAAAADIPRQAPVAAPALAPAPLAFSWTGFYGGLSAGYGWGDADSSTIVDMDINGGFFGGQIGYNLMLDNNLVVGIEADIATSGIDGRRPPFGPIPQTTTHEIDWFGTVRGRLGYAMGDVLPYITGGFAFADATRTTSAGGGMSAGASHTGYAVGAGVEWAFSEIMSAKIEYQYLDFGSETYNFPVGIDPVVDLDMHTVRVGVNAHF